MIALTDVSHRHQRAGLLTILHPTSSIPHGRIVAITGPSGGNSPLLGLLGLDTPTTGQVVITTSTSRRLVKKPGAQRENRHRLSSSFISFRR
jgi:ABC-type lipoprotein export system ATPase subunit